MRRNPQSHELNPTTLLPKTVFMPPPQTRYPGAGHERDTARIMKDLNVLSRFRCLLTADIDLQKSNTV